MNTITITCPKCHAANKVPKPSQEGANILCQQCNHVFKVVPKARAPQAKPQPAAASQPTTAAPAPKPAAKSAAKPKPKLSLDEVIDSLMPQQAKFNRRPAVVAEKPQDDAPKPKAEAHQPSISTLLSRSAPEPEAKTEQNQSQSELAANAIKATLAQVSGNHVTEQLPAVMMTPNQPDAAQGLHDDMETQTIGNNNTVNNLVFTLLSSQEHHHEQPDVPLLLNDTIEKTENISATQKALTEQQTKLHHEFNWTLASLVALTVLIIQLFYLMSVK